MDSCFLEKCKDVQFTDLSFNYWLTQTFVHTCIYTCRQKGDNHIMGNRCKIRELSLKRIFIKTCACHCQVSNYWNLCTFSGCLSDTFIWSLYNILSVPFVVYYATLNLVSWRCFNSTLAILLLGFGLSYAEQVYDTKF